MEIRVADGDRRYHAVIQAVLLKILLGASSWHAKEFVANLLPAIFPGAMRRWGAEIGFERYTALVQ